MGRALVMVPLMSMALGNLKGQELAQATGLSNIMRQLGSAIGIALINIYIESQNAFVRGNMVTHINSYNDVVSERVSALSQTFATAGYSPENATSASYQVLESILSKQQQIVTYNNVYLTVGLLFLICIPIVLLIRNPHDKTGKAIKTDLH
ncbi:MAG TPA: hypothetical protein VHO90_06275 [Bacteroidales bacterium]|nr:hypothetical protein [Bacteroidales bacterium]